MHIINRTLALVAVAASLSGAGSGQTMRTGKKETLLQSDHSWLGTKYGSYPKGAAQLTVLKVTIAPHSALPWHTHSFPNAGYVLSGTLTVQDKASGRSAVVHAGESFAESVGSIHRGVAGDTPTVIVVTYAGVVGAATSNPIKGGMQEY